LFGGGRTAVLFGEALVLIAAIRPAPQVSCRGDWIANRAIVFLKIEEIRG
jgi:hypothetical protein